MLKINIQTIPHTAQRYPTVGDWLITDSPDGLNLDIRVSSLSDWRRELLVAIHELIEIGLLAHKHGTTAVAPIQKIVDDFDTQFEVERERGLHPIDAEPGDDPHAPYRDEHFFATSIERLLAQSLNVDWPNYDAEVVSL
jgi:hypothetical protein